MKTITITFLNPIRYTDIDSITEENGIYYIFQKTDIDNVDYNNYIKYNYFCNTINTNSYIYKPLYIGKSCRNKSRGGIRERIKEHINSEKDKKIYDYIKTLKSIQSIGIPTDMFITTYTGLESDDEIELVEAALIFSNKTKLCMNEQNTISYNREYVTINIIGNTYGLNPVNIARKNT